MQDEAHAKAGSVGSAQAKVDQAQAALTAAQASAAAQEEVIQGEQARLDALVGEGAGDDDVCLPHHKVREKSQGH
jgi:outer membrane protein TolC